MVTSPNAPSYSVADPYPWYQWLQQESSVYKTPDGSWMITGYEEAEMLLQDKRCSHWGQDNTTFQHMPPLEKAIAQTLHALSPEGNPPFRKQLMHQLAAKNLNIDSEGMKIQADKILDKLTAYPQFEFMNDYAHPFTFGIICHIMGVPLDEIYAFSDITAGLKGGYLSFISEKIQTETENKQGRLFIDIIRRLIAIKSKTPGNDLCSTILAICPLKENESSIISLIVLLFYAGHQNMMNFMGNALLALQGKTAAQKMLRESLPFAIESVDELIRYDSPLQYILLLTREAINLHGNIIPAGSRLLINVGAANRDPAKFKDPDELILTRKPVHLGFGSGTFRCIGARLAQIQGGVGLHRFFTYVNSYSPVQNSISWNNFAVQRGPSSILLAINWNHEK